jgi:2-keto-3-deoxy-L-rhamnonate aldolase RhmA
MDGQIKLSNPALERMRADEVALGMLVRLARSGDIARVAKTTGHDFIFIDTQHAIYSLETVGHIVQAAIGCGVAPFVRVRNCDDHDMLRLLDCGVMGIVVPDVGTPEQARRAVELCKFPPVGRRSVSAGYPLLNFRPTPLAETVKTLNAATAVVCMIETLEGLANVEAIAEVDGVDVLHVGCNDLLVDMGKPGAFGEPEIMDAVARVIAACRKAGKFAGLGGDRDIGRQAKLIEQGIRFVTTQSDLAFLMAEATRRVDELRKASR